MCSPVSSIDVVGEVITPNLVESPLSRTRAAFVHIEILECPRPGEPYASLGAMILGDLVTFSLELEGRREEIAVLVRRAELTFVSARDDGLLLRECPAEIAPLLLRARGGELRWREHAVYMGGRLRLQAPVERSERELIVRTDLGRIVLGELVEIPHH